MSDEDIIKMQRREEQTRLVREREEARVQEMLRTIRDAKNSNSNTYHNMLDKHKASARPTIESIAKQREIDKKIKEMEAKQKFK
jgi:hypothetical protein